MLLPASANGFQGIGLMLIVDWSIFGLPRCHDARDDAGIARREDFTWHALLHLTYLTYSRVNSPEPFDGHGAQQCAPHACP